MGRNLPGFGEYEGRNSMTMWIENSSYFKLLEIFEKDKGAVGITMANRRFIEARKELIKRYSKHSEGYKYWLGRVHKERRQIFDKALHKFFESVSRGRPKSFESCVQKGVYDIYSTNVAQQKAPPLDTRRFITHLSQTEGNRSKIKIFPQQVISTRLDKQNTFLNTYLSNFLRYRTRLANNFAYHVHPMPSVSDAKIKERAKRDRRLTIDNSRITLRLVPAKAAEVFRKVATEIVGSRDPKWETVFSSKIMGPVKLPQSVDSMIIYVNSRERQVIKNIVDFLTTNFPSEDYFRPGGPMGMFELGRGITYADSSDPNKGKSFGSSRGKSIEGNLTSLFLEALGDPKKNVFDVVDSMSEHTLHIGSYNTMRTSNLDYTMPAFRRPFSNMAVDPFGHPMNGTASGTFNKLTGDSFRDVH